MLDGGLDPRYRGLLGSTGGRWMNYIEVWWNGARVDPYGADGLPVDSGSVTVALNNRVTRTLDASIPASLFPWKAGDLLSPLGARLKAFCGWQFGSGAPWLFQVLDGPVMSADLDLGEDMFTLRASDIAEGVVADKFLSPVDSMAGVQAVWRWQRLIQETYPNAVFGQIDDQYTKVVQATWDSDRAGACDSLASAAGCMWFATGDGKFTWRRIPWAKERYESAVASFSPGAGLISARVSTGRDDVYNAVSVTGETANANAPVHASVWDADPNSATYLNGPLGCRTLNVREDVGSTDQARSIAVQRLAMARSRHFDWSATIVPDPSLELCDVCDLTHGDRSTRSALVGMTIPLVGSSNLEMSTTWREAGGLISE